MNLILASNSPRRKELLASLGFTFTVEPRNADESFPSELASNEVAEFIANKKADAFLHDIGDRTILTADTVVVQEKNILGKPKNEEEAKSFLSMMSNNIHQVITGVCILSKNKRVSFSSVSTVHVSDLSDEEIQYYIDEYQPYDKAGAYGIQEWFGHAKVTKIEGSYFNIVGLPTDRVYEELNKLS